MNKSLRLCMPLYLSALERLTTLIDWIKLQIGKNFFTLHPNHWFLEAHDIRYLEVEDKPRALSFESTTYLWSLPPSIGDVALEELQYTRLKR